MPIKNRSNNHVLPNNARAADVARATMNAIIPTQVRRYDAAFLVQGYRGILYNRLSNGRVCPCKAKSKTIGERLGLDGKASPTAINEMLTGGEFGVKKYGSGLPNVEGYTEQKKSGPGYLEVSIGKYANPKIATVSMPQDYSKELEGNGVEKARNGGGLLERRATSASADPSANLILDENDLESITDMESLTRFDLGLLGYTDVSCPICMGSGFVGGYAPLGGFRKIFCFGEPVEDMVLPASAEIQTIEDIPTITTTSVDFWFTFPASVKFVDAFQLWNNSKPVGLPNTVDFEDCCCEVVGPEDLLRYCDGKRHRITLNWTEAVTFTHLEIQFGLSGFEANFELPKLSRGSDQSILENTDPFQVILSPRIPLVRPLDILVESTHGKVLEVKSVSGWNDRKKSVLGWEADVRPVQPQELFSMLPRRKPLEDLNSRGIVLDNFNSSRSDGPSRT